MEDFSIRAIVIGVSLFITMLTLSAILLYFNTARSVADVVSKREDIASNFDRLMNSDNFETTLTGVEVRTIISKYAGNKDVKINIIKISGNEVVYNNINNSTSWLVEEPRKNGDTETEKYLKLIREDRLDIVNPVWNNKVNKVEKNGVITLNIELDV